MEFHQLLQQLEAIFLVISQQEISIEARRDDTDDGGHSLGVEFLTGGQTQSQQLRILPQLLQEIAEERFVEAQMPVTFDTISFRND